MHFNIVLQDYVFRTLFVFYAERNKKNHANSGQLHGQTGSFNIFLGVVGLWAAEDLCGDPPGGDPALKCERGWLQATLVPLVREPNNSREEEGVILIEKKIGISE